MVDFIIGIINNRIADIQAEKITVPEHAMYKRMGLNIREQECRHLVEYLKENRGKIVDEFIDQKMREIL